MSEDEERFLCERLQSKPKLSWPLWRAGRERASVIGPGMHDFFGPYIPEDERIPPSIAMRYMGAQDA